MASGSRPGARRWLTCAALLAIGGAAGATTPPIYTHRQELDHFRERVERDAKACPDLSKEPGVFGSAEVRFSGSRRFTVHVSRALGPRFEVCVTKAVRAVIFDEGVDFPMPVSAYDRQFDGGNRFGLWFGKPRSNLPEPGRLLPIWKAAQGRATAALRAAVPADVAVTKDGCLLPDGEAIRAGVELWVEQWTKPVPLKWWPLFGPALSAPHFFDREWFVAQREDRRYCLLRFDEARAQAMRPHIEEAGACWHGGVIDVVLAPRAAFPADRRYRSVSVARDRACAVDAAGTLICCGSPRPQPAPPGTFKAVSVGRVHACAIRGDDTVACWSDPAAPALAPFSGRYAEVVVGEGSACARRLDGGFECRGLPVDVSGDVRKVSLGADGTCILRRNGSLACAGYGDTLSLPKAAIAVDRNYVTCVLVEGGDVLCPQTGHDGPWGYVSRERFKAIAATSWGGCGRHADDTLGCWGRVPSAVPPGRFTALDSGDSHICGIRDDGRIVCWGERSAGFFWTDFD